MAGISAIQLVKSFPATLTNTDWQKKKGVGGKMTKTGLGAELTKLEKLVKKVDPEDFNPYNGNPNRGQAVKTKAQLEKCMLNVKESFRKVILPIRNQVQVVMKKATAAEKLLKTTKLGKGAAKAAANITKAASNFLVATKSIDVEPYVKLAKKNIKKLNDIAQKLMAGSLTKFVTGAKKFLKDPTEDSWDKNVKQQGRSISNCIKQLKPYNDRFWKIWESEYKGFDLSTMKLKGDPQFDQKATLKVYSALKTVKAIGNFKFASV